MKMIKIKHPTLDDGRVTEVSEQSMSHWAAAGWVPDEPAPEPVPAPEEAPPAPAVDNTEPPTRRGRISKEVSD